VDGDGNEEIGHRKRITPDPSLLQKVALSCPHGSTGTTRVLRRYDIGYRPIDPNPNVREIAHFKPQREHLVPLLRRNSIAALPP
jgi:hypothetical protein